MKEKLFDKLKEVTQEKEKIVNERQQAFVLLDKINEQKIQIEETIESIQIRENEVLQKENELNLVLKYILNDDKEG